MEEEDATGPRSGARIMSEVFLTRLLSTKVREREGGKDGEEGSQEWREGGRKYKLDFATKLIVSS